MQNNFDGYPLRVAIIGSGPAGFYTAGQLLKQDDIQVEIDLLDRLPTPYGLVRGGVAPDHQKIKSVTKSYERIAKSDRVRYFGYVEFGSDLTLESLRAHYHQIVFATGAQKGRMLNIPGAYLKGSHPASDFVAWYNGHPDYRDLEFDFSHEKVAVIGMGNVALDVARILCRTPEELHKTDIADYALEALQASKVRDVYLLGRRGPVQAAYTPSEIKEIGQLSATDVIVSPRDAQLDALSQAVFDASTDRELLKNVQTIQAFAARKLEGRNRRLHFRFMTSPTEILGDSDGRVAGIQLVRNKLVRTENGILRAQQTNEYDHIPVGLVLHSIGYRGVPLPGIPFDDYWGIIPNQNGRVIDPETGKPIPGLYTAGWIKRGPSGVIGTNKPDAADTVASMVADVKSGAVLTPPFPDKASAEMEIANLQPDYILFDDWLHLDQIEILRGVAQQRPRIKFSDIKEMLSAVDQVDSDEYLVRS